MPGLLLPGFVVMNELPPPSGSQFPTYKSPWIVRGDCCHDSLKKSQESIQFGTCFLEDS